MSGTLDLGRAGEARAAAWYRANGYRVLARNWQVRAGELDLIASRRGVIVFCEVKTRTTAAFGTGAEAVGVDKQRRVRRLAALWLRSSGRRRRYRQLRFDVAAVDGAGNVTVIEGCF